MSADTTMTLRFDVDELADRPRDLPTLALDVDGGRAAVAMPEIGYADGALVTPEEAIKFGLELVRLGRVLQAAEQGRIVGRP